jgi:hypothetical protein
MHSLLSAGKLRQLRERYYLERKRKYAILILHLHMIRITMEREESR